LPFTQQLASLAPAFCAGKTFQCNLAYKKLGISPIVMSAGELESGNAGEPAKLIRQRYREASDIIKKGKVGGQGEPGMPRMRCRSVENVSPYLQANPPSAHHPPPTTTFLTPPPHLPQMASLFINDLDAGAGRMGDATQYTVNNQMVNATLMNIADNPTNVQLPGE